MAYQLPDERRQALLEAIPNGPIWGSLILFMDTVDSLEELAALTSTFREHVASDDLWLLDFYKENLTKWPQPKLEEAFTNDFPRVSKRLDTAWKVRIFLRAVISREVQAETMASVFEELIYRHEELKENFLWYPQYRRGEFGTALRIVYHTETEYWTLKRLMFNPDPPTLRGHITGVGLDGLYVDWRSEAERKASGCRW